MVTDEMTFEDVRAMFRLRPQEDGEGTWIHQNLDDGFGTAIVALCGGEAYSALHRLHATEVYHFYAGAPRRMLLLYPDGRIEEPVLGRGYGNEIAEVGRCLRAGLRESPLVPLEQTLTIMRQMDDLRAQVGVAFPG